MPELTEHFFSDRDEASRAAAEFIASRLGQRLDVAGEAALVVSGGTTPVSCFDRLAGMPLDWQRIQVLLSDERWVPPEHADSNEKLVREHLLQRHAARAELLPVYDATSSPQARCALLDRRATRRPFACSLLGMGTDGHFASLFPDAQNLAAGLDTAGSAVYIPILTAASPYPRISMTLPALLDSTAILLLIFGTGKRAVYAAAAAGDTGLPVAALLHQEQTPVHVFWAV